MDKTRQSSEKNTKKLWRTPSFEIIEIKSRTVSNTTKDVRYLEFLGT